ncbi:hypothetical protein CSX11_29465 [Mycobacterium goodii]|nr:hypothetical protein CSX11_29465 [Mycolicibacterium goodii]
MAAASAADVVCGALCVLDDAGATGSEAAAVAAVAVVAGSTGADVVAVDAVALTAGAVSETCGLIVEEFV